MQTERVFSVFYTINKNINRNIKFIPNYITQDSIQYTQKYTNSIIPTFYRYNSPHTISTINSNNHNKQYKFSLDKQIMSFSPPHITQAKQQQEQKKQLLLNNYIDQLLSLQTSKPRGQVVMSKMKSLAKNEINFMELFDLLIWTQKKKPQLLLNILQMNILTRCVNVLTQEQMLQQIKAFILLINNCKVNGEIIMFLLVNKLLDQIIWNYLLAITNQSRHNCQGIDQELQYLGSLLKACNNHVNQKTYLYFMNPPHMFSGSNLVQQSGKEQQKKEMKKQKKKEIQMQKNKQQLENEKEKGKGKENDKQKQKQQKSQKIISQKSSKIISQKSQKIIQKQSSKIIQHQQSQQQSSIFDPNDIFNTFDQMLISYSQLSIQAQQKYPQEETPQQQQTPQQETPQSQQTSLNKKPNPKHIHKQCLLIKICTRFYNCPQQLTKTTVMNILMNIFRQPFANQLIIDPLTSKPYQFITQWSHNMCCVFRNQLKNFNQQLMVLEQAQQWFFIQEISDKVMFWQDLTQCQLAQQIFGQNFMHLVVYSLIIGSLNTHSLPMFNIKFTFFILAKLMKVCSNLGLMQHLGRLLILKNQVKYSQNWVSTAVLKGFDPREILNDKYCEIDCREQEEVNQFSGINQFFFNILKSKDQHFLHISSNMLHQMIFTVRKDEKTLKAFNQTLGLTLNNLTLVKITSTLIGQLKFDHSLKTLKQVCQTLIFLHPSKQLSQQNSNEFIFFYSEYLNETLDLLNKGSKHWSYITETFEYDMKILDMLKFIHKPLSDKELLIHPSERAFEAPINEEKDDDSAHKNTFYNSIPQTPNQILRYRIIKTFMMLKFNEIIIQPSQNTKILSKYVQKLRIWQEKQLKPGDKIPYPLKQKFHQCKIIQQKTQIPCILIQDDVYLIMGFIQANNVKVIVNTKLKHIQPQIYTKKDKPYIRLKLSKFDYETQNIIPKSTIIIKGLQTGLQYFAVKKQNFKEKELNSIRKGLKRTVQNLPQISLL